MSNQDVTTHKGEVNTCKIKQKEYININDKDTSHYG